MPIFASILVNTVIVKENEKQYIGSWRLLKWQQYNIPAVCHLGYANNKWEKISHCSWLNLFCNFNKKKYIFNLHSKEYAVFYAFDYFIKCM